MFSSLPSVLRYIKMIVTTPEEHHKVVLRKISDRELNFLTIKPIQKQSPRSVL